MPPLYLAVLMLHFLLGFASPVNPPDDPDDGVPDEPLPQTMATICTGKQVDNEARIKTMARMMDWCYCGNTLNPNGLEYAGFSVYEDGIDPQERNPSRTWVCSKNKQEPCDAIEDWYNALGNVTQECGYGYTGYFYDAVREMACAKIAADAETTPHDQLPSNSCIEQPDGEDTSTGPCRVRQHHGTVYAGAIHPLRHRCCCHRADAADGAVDSHGGRLISPAVGRFHRACDAGQPTRLDRPKSHGRGGTQRAEGKSSSCPALLPDVPLPRILLRSIPAVHVTVLTRTDVNANSSTHRFRRQGRWCPTGRSSGTASTDARNPTSRPPTPPQLPARPQQEVRAPSRGLAGHLRAHLQRHVPAARDAVPRGRDAGARLLAVGPSVGVNPPRGGPALLGVCAGMRRGQRLAQDRQAARVRARAADGRGLRHGREEGRERDGGLGEGEGEAAEDDVGAQGAEEAVEVEHQDQVQRAGEEVCGGFAGYGNAWEHRGLVEGGSGDAGRHLDRHDVPHGLRSVGEVRQGSRKPVRGQSVFQ